MVLKANMPHILAVDDDDRIRRLLAQYLSKNGYIVITAEDALQARKILKDFVFDLCILDIMMPGESGIDLALHIQTSYEYPVLLLTAMTETEDRIAGLEAGADDYLSKPFEPKELLLRAEAILRRTYKPHAQSQKQNKTIILDGYRFYVEEARLVHNDGADVKLTDGDLTILSTLAQKLNIPVKREMLATQMDLNSNDRAVDVAVTRLRKKIEKDPSNPNIITTLRGKGYMMKGRYDD